MSINPAIKSLGRDGRFSLEDANAIRSMVQNGTLTQADARDAAGRYGDVTDADARGTLAQVAGAAVPAAAQQVPARTQAATLQKGARGDDVKGLQHGLMSLSAKEGNASFALASGVDGIFGDETKAAVTAFQKSQGLRQTGVADPPTLRALDRRLRGLQAPSAATPPPTPTTTTTAPTAAPATARPVRGLASSGAAQRAAQATPAQQWQKVTTAGRDSIAAKTASHNEGIDRSGLGDLYGDHSDFATAVHGGDKDAVNQQLAAMTGGGDWSVQSMKINAVTIQNAQTGEVKTLHESSCIGWVMDNVKAAYTAAGKGDRFEEIRQKVKAGQMSGVILCEELKKDGWSAVFYSPRTADDLKAGTAKTDQDKYWALKMAQAGKPIWREGGNPSSTGVRPDAVVTGYRDTTPDAATDAALRQIEASPFFVGIANGGIHTFVGHDGNVSEEHWRAQPNDKGGLQETPLREWIWDTGLYMLPPGTWTKPAAPNT